jgi:hypothetical protein
VTCGKKKNVTTPNKKMTARDEDGYFPDDDL